MLERALVGYVGQEEYASVYVPREQVRWKTAFQERRRARGLLLAREELETCRRVRVLEHRLLMHAAHDQETAVEDTRRRWVPPLLNEDEVRVLNDGAAFADWGRARLEETNGLVTRLDDGIAGEPSLVSANASLTRGVVVSGL